MEDAEMAVRLSRLPNDAVLSINRGLTAPIETETGQDMADLIHLIRHDTDPFGVWQASRFLLSPALREGPDSDMWKTYIEVKSTALLRWNNPGIAAGLAIVLLMYATVVR
jgi:hypothetical protein